MRAILAFLALFACVSAVMVGGDAYSVDDLFPRPGVVLKFEGPTTYQAVLEEGNYSVELPPGEYTVTAYYYEESKLKYYFQEKMKVEGEEINYDIMLFPPNEFEQVVEFIGEADTGEEILEIPEPEPAEQKEAAGIGLEWILLPIALLVVAAYLLIFRKKGASKAPEEVKKVELPPKELDAEEKKLLEILKSSEGMSTQKELRDIFKCTETKMSLLVSSLEARGLVKRIKRGRENIVKLKE